MWYTSPCFHWIWQQHGKSWMHKASAFNWQYAIIRRPKSQIRWQHLYHSCSLVQHRRDVAEVTEKTTRSKTSQVWLESEQVAFALLDNLQIRVETASLRLCPLLGSRRQIWIYQIRFFRLDCRISQLVRLFSAYGRLLWAFSQVALSRQKQRDW